MRRDPEAVGASAGLWLKILAVVLVLLFAGPLIPLLLVGVPLLYRALKKSGQKRADDGASPQREERAALDFSPVFDQPAIRREKQPVAAGSAAVASSIAVPEEQRRHAQELRDLLRAGIIEQEEYNERMQGLKNRTD